MSDLIETDGENRAVRAFLLLYGGSAGVTTTQMRRHMEASGYPLWPEWAAHADRHLTKGGAQDWLRHLFALEARAQPAPITSESGNQAAQGASAITSESVPVLTDEEIRQVAQSPFTWDNYRAIEQAVRAKMGAGAQWQPISTAPKDFVTEFDGWNGERVPNVSWAHPEYSPKGHLDWCVSEYETGHGWVNVAVKNLTHWRPLPPPPGIVGEKGGA